MESNKCCGCASRTMLLHNSWREKFPAQKWSSFVQSKFNFFDLQQAFSKSRANFKQNFDVNKPQPEPLSNRQSSGLRRVYSRLQYFFSSMIFVCFIDAQIHSNSLTFTQIHSYISLHVVY